MQVGINLNRKNRHITVSGFSKLNLGNIIAPTAVESRSANATHPLSSRGFM